LSTRPSAIRTRRGKVYAVDVRWTTGFLDSPTADVEPFWLALTGSTLSARRDGGVFVTLVPAHGDAYLRAQVTGEPARTHLDLHVAGVPQAAREAVALGAQVIRDAGSLVVLRSPAGLEFCLVQWHGETRRPPAQRWPGGRSSLLDQICLDIPGAQFDPEASFWSSLTGWKRQPSDLPEFESLARPDGMPLRILLQSIATPGAGMHPDFACDDVPAEVARHVALGAQVVREVPGDWTTLRDPAGREYCVTARSPF
jgi:predicted enzyme related to lactoylglutathione lyase